MAALHESSVSLAQHAATSIWMPAALTILGCALLAVIACLLWRLRAGANAPAPTALTDAELDRVKRAGDRVSLLTAAAEQAADALDERIGTLRTLLSTADDRIDAVESATAVESDPTFTRPAQPGSRAPSYTHVESKPLIVEPALDPLTRAVYDLADAGRTPVEIAGQLHEHTGKVELILNLRREKAETWKTES